MIWLYGVGLGLGVELGLGLGLALAIVARANVVQSSHLMTSLMP